MLLTRKERAIEGSLGPPLLRVWVQGWVCQAKAAAGFGRGEGGVRLAWALWPRCPSGWRKGGEREAPGRPSIGKSPHTPN